MTGKKWKVLNGIERELHRRNSRQGSRADDRPLAMHDAETAGAHTTPHHPIDSTLVPVG